MSNSPTQTINPQTHHSLSNLSRQARIYLYNGAWQSAYDHIQERLSPHLSNQRSSPEAIECLCLQITASAQLGKKDNVVRGCDRLNRMLDCRIKYSSECSALIAYCLSIRDVDGGNYARARRRLQKARARVDENVTLWTRARIEIIMARTNLRYGDLQATEEHAFEVTRIANILENDTILGAGLSFLALIVSRRGAHEEADILFTKAANALQHSRVGNSNALVVLHLSRAALLNRMGRLSESSQEFQKCLQTSISLGRKATALRARLGLGWTAARQGNLTAARPRLLSAWREARRQKLAREEALALEYLSEVYLLKGSLPKARVATRLCRQLADRIAPKGDIALEITIREAMLYIAEDQLKDAVSTARAAIAHAKRAEMPWEQAQAHRVLGVAYARLGRKQSARNALASAEEPFITVGEKLELQVVKAWLKALDKKSRKSQRPIQQSSENVEKLEPASLDSCAKSDDPNKDQDCASEALRFWLNHPLLGPIPWQNSRKRGKSKQRKTPNQSSESSSLHKSHHLIDLEDENKHQQHQPINKPNDSVWEKLGLVTQSSELVANLDRIPAYANEQIPILILGETGTGKDLIVKGLHELSRFPGKLVPVNCADVSRELFAAELFGARKGAFTGAERNRPGLVEEAREGTLFLDEIGDLDLKAQGYLLRFLDSGEIRPRGATKNHFVQTRVVAATCRELTSMCARGEFRHDLYARLAGLIIEIPPLRKRIDDLPLLINSLWSRVGGDPADCQAIFTDDVIVQLKQQPWPQNIRQLKYTINNIRLACKVTGVEQVRREILDGKYPISQISPHLTHSPQRYKKIGYNLDADGLVSSTPKPMSEWDPEMLRETLTIAGGNISKAAELLGVSRSHAYRIYRLLRDDNAENIQRQPRKGNYLDRNNP